jgi:hypothetical protein
MPKTEKKKEVSWEEPPARPPQYDWAAIAESLKARPNQWAKIWDKDRSSVVVAVRQGSILAVHPSLGFETRTTNNTLDTPRTCTLYMRWNPDAVESGLTAAILASRKERK